MQLFFIDTAEDLTNDMLLTKDLLRDVVEMIASALSTNPYSLVFKRFVLGTIFIVLALL